MVNFKDYAPYNLTNHVNRQTILNEFVVDAKNCILLDSKNHTWNTPKNVNIPEYGTYRITRLYGAARTNSGSKWQYGISHQTSWTHVFGFGDPHYVTPNDPEIKADNVLPGFYNLGGFNTIEQAEHYDLGLHKDYQLQQGELPFWYADNGPGDNEGSMIYHIKKIA